MKEQMTGGLQVQGLCMAQLAADPPTPAVHLPLLGQGQGMPPATCKLTNLVILQCCNELWRGY